MGKLYSEEGRKLLCDRVSSELSRQIAEALRTVDIGNTIARKCEKVLREQAKGTQMELCLTEEWVSSFIGRFGAEMTKLVDEEAASFIEPEIGLRLKGMKNLL